MWTWVQSTGELYCDGQKVAAGYSGFGAGRNNPEMQNLPTVGPIPAGQWKVSALITETQNHGPFVLKLVPCYGTNTFGRADFLIHGDSISSPGSASRGCIVLSRPVRERIWRSADRDLEVVKDLTPQLGIV